MSPFADPQDRQEPAPVRLIGRVQGCEQFCDTMSTAGGALSLQEAMRPVSR